MASNQDHASLMTTLKDLYSRVMSLHLRTRADPGFGQESMGMSQDFASSISNYLNKQAAYADKNKGDVSDSQIKNGECNGSREPASINREYSSEMGLGELSVHLKDAHKHSSVSLNTGEKLVQSTWEHFHASIRLARQGDEKVARMHADLANSALKEAARYLSEAEYASFSKEVMEALKEMNEQVA